MLGFDVASPRWLLTGASGRVGRMIGQYWKTVPPPATVVRQSRRPCSEWDDLHQIFWDPLRGPLPNALGHIDCLIAYAGITPAYNLDMDVNVKLAEATLRAAYQAEIPRVLLTSSSAVYGDPLNAQAACETDTTRPVSAYGRSKLDMEDICNKWRERGVEICCLRVGNVAGADVLLLNGEGMGCGAIKIDRFSDGSGPLRSYIGPETLARITETLAASSCLLPDCLNVGAPVPVAMTDLANAAGFIWEWRDAPPSAFQRIVLNVEKLSDLYLFEVEDSDPQEMVRQWFRLRGGNDNWKAHI